MVRIEIFAYGAHTFTELGVILEGSFADTEGVIRLRGSVSVERVVAPTLSFGVFSQIIFAGAGRVVFLKS